MHVLVTCKYKNGSDQKPPEKRWRHCFPHYKSMGAFCCHGNQNFDPICPKTLCYLSPTPLMLHIKFDQDWPTGFRDIQVWKCGRRQQTDDWPLVYNKLTLWAFGSGELKIKHLVPLDGCACVFEEFVTICEKSFFEKVQFSGVYPLDYWFSLPFRYKSISDGKFIIFITVHLRWRPGQCTGTTRPTCWGVRRGVFTTP